MTASLPGAEKPVLDIRSLSIALPRDADRPFAVEDINLSIHPREILCVVGESGSGKSVTSFAVMGLLAQSLGPARGEIWFEGKNLLSLSPAELRALRGKRMSMIFQEPMTALSPTMRVGRQIEETLRVHTRMGRSQRHARVLDLMRLVSLSSSETLCRRYPHQLSGGQRQRVMIAMALAHEPALLIADEPTTALDVTTQAQILEQIRHIQERSNTAVLFVTHDFGVVADIADRVVVMQSGKIVERGSVQEVLGSPKHPYTQSLLAAIPGVRSRRPRAPNAAASEILRVQNLSKVYGTPELALRRKTAAPAVDKVNLVIRRGETLAVVGESGSGKSTMARCVCGLIDPSGGVIEINGTEITDRAQHLQRHRLVQLVFQDPNRSLDPRWTVGKSLAEGMKNIGVPAKEARERTISLIDKVGLKPNAIDRYPHEFSGGQRQRICIARAISMEPQLLVADEAVSALDVSVQAQILALLNRLQSEMNLSMLFITHDLRVAAQIADNIAIMQNGQVVEQGPALEVLANPQHEYSRRLFDAAPGRLLAQ